ncbi:MAG: DEAD/DEAH box helicase [Myxococcales bacterium]|nr:DEAD/DEAH box helicase [Myxococcales bacterium]
MTWVPDNPLVVQGDHTLLLETQSPRYEEARDALLAFAELVKSPEYVHTWRITPLSLWNAAAAGHTPDEVEATLSRYARYPVPQNVLATVREKMARYGTVRLVRDGAELRLEVDDPVRLAELRSLKTVADLIGPDAGTHGAKVLARRRGEIKQALLAAGHPVEDLAGYEPGTSLTMALGEETALREYQIEAVDRFLGGETGGSGVVVLPCGAGKTLVGIGAMVRLGMRTLVLCAGHTALQQWKREILARTTLTEEEVGEYEGTHQRLFPVTLTTYQLLTWRPSASEVPPHFRVFHEAGWGLVIYDEVHLLPAPIFRETAWLQARRRLGLTATLVREDGREGDVFALVGPKRFDLPWRTLEHQGWIATATCIEVRVPLTDEDRLAYVGAPSKRAFTIAVRNPRKLVALEKLLERHRDDPTLVIGTDLQQLEWIARRFSMPLITGKTSRKERDELFTAFRDGERKVLAVSKVGNFSVDLPNASVAIQVSGTWGSRQEEAQRLGRVLRPKPDGGSATFYAVVSAETSEQSLAEHRQLFLAEQGYPYRIETGLA